MQRLVTLLLTAALLAGCVDFAEAKSMHKKGNGTSQSGFVQRNVGLGGPSYGRPPNASLKYGPQPYYPQSPPGGGP